MNPERAQPRNSASRIRQRPPTSNICARSAVRSRNNLTSVLTFCASKIQSNRLKYSVKVHCTFSKYLSTFGVSERALGNQGQPDPNVGELRGEGASQQKRAAGWRTRDRKRVRFTARI